MSDPWRYEQDRRAWDEQQRRQREETNAANRELSRYWNDPTWGVYSQLRRAHEEQVLRQQELAREMTPSDGPARSQAEAFHDPTSHGGSTDVLPDGLDDLVALDLPGDAAGEPDASQPLTPDFDPTPRSEVATDLDRPLGPDTWRAEGNDTARMDSGPDGAIRAPRDAERVGNDGLDPSRNSADLTSDICSMSQSSLRHDDIVRLDLAPVDNSAVDRHVEDMARDNLADWRYWNDPVYGFWARLKRAFDESQRPEGGGYPHTAESGRPGELPPAAPGSSAAIEEPGPEATREEWQSFLATLDVQDHHVATNKSLASGITAMMAEVAGKVGLDLDDEWNMITVPHEGRHPPEYHAYVLGTMQHIAEEVAALPPDSARVEFLRQFQELIADAVREDPQMLRRAAWRDRRHRKR